MTYPSFNGSAVFELPFENVQEFAKAYSEWLTDEQSIVLFPPELFGVDLDGIQQEALSYIKKLNPSEFEVLYDTQDDPTLDSDVFDSLVMFAASKMKAGSSTIVNVNVQRYSKNTAKTIICCIGDKNVSVTAAIDDRQALDEIEGLLTGSEWDADLLCEIAKVVRSTGRGLQGWD